MGNIDFKKKKWETLELEGEKVGTFNWHPFLNWANWRISGVRGSQRCFFDGSKVRGFVFNRCVFDWPANEQTYFWHSWFSCLVGNWTDFWQMSKLVIEFYSFTFWYINLTMLEQKNFFLFSNRIILKIFLLTLVRLIY